MPCFPVHFQFIIFRVFPLVREVDVAKGQKRTSKVSIRLFLTAGLFIGLTTQVCAPKTAPPLTQPEDWGKYQDEAVRLLREYIKTDTANPPGNETRAAEFFKRLFDKEGIPNTVYPYAKDRANIFAVLKGDGSERPLILLNHLDSVSADSSDWRVSPLTVIS